MYILLALIAGAAAGAIIHLLVGHRSTRGVILSGTIGTIIAGAVYTIMTWMGIAQTNPLLWLASIGGSIVLTWMITAVLAKTRSTHDARALAAAGLR